MATAERLVRDGANVVVLDISGREEEAAARLGAKAEGFHADVSSPADIQALMSFTERRFGRLDILVNNAGIDGEFAPLLCNTDENFEKVLAANTKSALLCVKYGAPLMQKVGGGSIVNVSSTAALKAVVNLTTYAASKSALFGLTLTAAVELGPIGVRINTVCPGPIDTPMLREMMDEAGMERMRNIVPLGRLGTPGELAGVIAFLASDEASFINGAIIPVDGGQSA